jgi:hypothetical protein
MRRLVSVLMAVAAPLMAERVCMEVTPQRAAEVAAEVYVYGYPLVTSEVTRRVMTNVAEPGTYRAPMGQWAHQRKFPSETDSDVAAPNGDTLHSSAWLDLSNEPYVLHIPATGNRFWMMSILDGWSNVIADPGSRTLDAAADYVIMGPHWQGTLPDCALTPIRADTNLVWILGRVMSTGTEADLLAVRDLQDRFCLFPLSAWGHPYTPPCHQVDRKIDMATSVRDQVNRMDVVSYFNLLAALLKENPPAATDEAMVVKMADIGLRPGQCYYLTDQRPCIAEGVVRAAHLGQVAIVERLQRLSPATNNWRLLRETGEYGNDYLMRAAMAVMAPGANLPEDAIYPFTSVDSSGQPLVGTNNYTITFRRGQTPPVEGYWSLSLYDDQYHWVANPLHRHSINPSHPLLYNPDGSLTLYIQKKSPGPELESNWLPAPEGSFMLMMRLYEPEKAALNGSWEAPAIQKVEPPICP